MVTSLSTLAEVMPRRSAARAERPFERPYIFDGGWLHLAGRSPMQFA
jgi:hypothetical protein